MFIYHFNRMIQNKVIWFLFASVVAIAFLSLPSCIGQGGADDRNSVGKIAGENVSREEYDLASLFVKSTTRNLDVPPAVTETQIWAHIAAVRSAKEMGLDATPVEIQQRLLMSPEFQRNGQFDKGLYQRLVAQNLGLSPSGYERLLAHEISLRKLSAAVGSGFAPSRMEIEDYVSALTDEITFQTAMISNQYANADFDVTESDMQSYFAEHEEEFALPDRVDIRYAIVPTSNFVAQVTVPQVDVLDYYESHVNDYMRSTTNGTEQIPFDEVSLVISNDLCLLEASDIADRSLIAFIDDLTSSTNDLESFAWRAKARGYATDTTGLVSPEKDYFTGIEPAAVEEFRDSALDLDARRPDSRYRTARGKKYVYLLQAVTNDPAHTPAFESLVDTIRPLAIQQARAKAFEDFASKKRSDVITAMTNATFEVAASAQGLNVSTSITFKVDTLDTSAFRYARVITPAVQRLSAGEVSEVLPVFNGALLANVSNRKEASAMDSNSTRERVVSFLSSMLETGTFQDWMIWNLLDKGFAPLDPYAFAGEATDAEYDD